MLINIMLKKNGRKIIVSVDDFGISEKANERILELAKGGKIDRVSVMISPNFNSEDIKELKETGVKLDLHLHLVDKDSDYWRGKRNLSEPVMKRLVSFSIKYIRGKNSPQTVEEKWREQLKKFQELFGRLPDGLNSHEHLHFFPKYRKIIWSLAHEASIFYIRFGKRRSRTWTLVAVIMDLSRGMSNILEKNRKVETSDYVVSFDWIKNKENYFSRFQKNDSIEMVFHPERDEEMEFLRKISDLGVISY